MKYPVNLEVIQAQLEEIISKAKTFEEENANLVTAVLPIYRNSARNLLHYVAFRSFDLTELQLNLRYLGLPDLSDIEGHVMESLSILETVIRNFLGVPTTIFRKNDISIKKSERLLGENTKLLFGSKPNKRNTRIMVTLPKEAAFDYKMVKRMIRLGMDTARINCAHDDESVWLSMIENVERASKSVRRRCSIMMDLSGPKLRTGAMKPGPKVIHIKPQRNSLGEVVQPARVWIAPPDVPPYGKKVDVVIPFDESFIERMQRGDTLWFTDSRNKKCRIDIVRKQKEGRWGLCSDSAYIITGNAVVLQKVKQSGKVLNYVGELLPSDQFMTLHTGDKLLLHKSPETGDPALYDLKGQLLSTAHISCSLPEIFLSAKPGETIFFDDGKIEGVLDEVTTEEMKVSITYAEKNGSKLKGDKGINFPETQLSISGLTDKDREDIPFVIQYAKAVNFSFINNAEDVRVLQEELNKYQKQPGIVLKIETRNGFANLPEIILQAMQSFPLGIMVARGDLAIETGWENFATVQEDIMRLAEAAHLPVIYATQVLESLTKKGLPTRAEITDAVLAQRAECVMLNKGACMEKALKTLDQILVNVQKHQKKRRSILPRLNVGNGLGLESSEKNTPNVHIQA